MKRRLKKIMQNCPYLLALLITWLFMTAGGIVLMIYRDYGNLDWKSFWSNPFFAVIMEEEMHQNSHRNEIQNPSKITTVVAKVANNSILAKPAVEIGDIARKLQEEYLEKEKEEEKEAPKEDPVMGKTDFVTYTPVETDSIYYYDVGKIALTTAYPYQKVGEEYFNDAAFFGDSRTLGISDYAGLNADFYCENGMTIYKLLDAKGVIYQKSGERVNLNEILQQKQYGKIYIMLGMNELGYGDTEYFQEQYRAVLEQIRQWQPDAVIYLLANLHVSLEKNNPATEFNNININAKNVAAASLANGVDTFYLDVNPLFTDENGYLKSDLTFDGVHLYAGSYAEWKEFLMEHGVS
ncbi:MAG: GDSL-type esterase/lipase family protein [Muribaculaceae bacterium]|nr:GDSL-type esterase/lipase family protein [Muribaculaceae bacterium]